MKMFFRTLVVFAFLFFQSTCIGQSKLQPAWTVKFNTTVIWQHVHSLGYIVACSADGLYGISPSNGNVIWKNASLAGIDRSMITEVEGTGLLAVTYRKEPGSSLPIQSLVEVSSGKVLFDSQKENLGVLSKHVMPMSKRLLVIGVKPGDLKNMVATLYMYDIESGRQLWVNEDLFKGNDSGAKGFIGKLQALSQQVNNIKQLIGEPVEVDHQHIIVTHPGYVIKLRSETGEVVWKSQIQTAIKAAVYFSPYKKGITYVATEVETASGFGFTSTTGGENRQQTYTSNVYYAFNSNTGAPLWSKPAKENDHLGLVVMQENGIMICPFSDKKPTINLINYETGVTMWGNKGKGIKAQGSVISYINTLNGILIATTYDNVWNSKSEEYYLNVVDPVAGKLKFEKPVKLKGDLVSSMIVPKGLLFVTTREVNILDMNTGNIVWDKSIEVDGSSLMSEKGRTLPIAHDEKALYVFSNREGIVFKVDKSAGIYQSLNTAKIGFQGKEQPGEIEKVSDGLILRSEQNILKIGFDGTTKFVKYYAAPRENALTRVLLVAASVRAAYTGVAASMYSAAFEQAASSSNEPAVKGVEQQIAQGLNKLGQTSFAYSGEAFQQFSARYKASKNTPSYVMMMTVQEKKGNQLIQVSKNDGSLMNSIDIRNDKEPEYDLDALYNHVYYKPSPLEIVCYKL
ncbi:hypothetical protein FAM09_09700 [Niastella caeni]|uniref:Pyrrolo-quinoline quinone repeat domain-containing protein n=1 Tax=Niastella caeni TaxID=2569763 RepID=A0A4S8I0X9_9BACT|nr:PQQ-binding-like beta-propeller repeat protein [Niastella caeni]THU40144.1 hypothetical protein FAM09_09700 [Niastella caeni]